ncbi:GNAT family N-acetyltransferase [Brevibacillus sp. HB1.3]|uniref:GNAT family N-acetyltransferase n=1 Tax=Brevibacillus sp. HB1.3 TaxID=2738842 RepID=UPI0015582240|nr:GNAT family N-acetyltransferase [Brevibacillus sp. HB1.3]NQF16142.1 GNAT family N-acetyltransferase [Brevibacillus sp. HB1.3]
MRIEQLQADSRYLKEIVELWNQNAIETAEYELTDGEMAGIEQQVVQYCRSAYGVVHIALDDDDQLVGYGLASLKKEMVYETYSGHVDELYVAPPYRKQKAGQAIYHSLKSWLLAQEVSHIQVFVDVKNESAQAFWEKTGLEKEFFVMSEEEEE